MVGVFKVPGADAAKGFTSRITGVIGVAVLVMLIVIGTFMSFGMAENLAANQLMVIQSPISGDLDVYTDPGLKWQGFGNVTKYDRRSPYGFSNAKNNSAGHDIGQPIKITFNDGGVGYVSGIVQWDMPLKPEAIIKLHKEYHGFAAIDQQLIRPMLEKVMFGAGATMSSFESNTDRRAEIPQIIEDQIVNGPYLTKSSIITQKDPITGQDKQVRIAQVQLDKDGKIIRASGSTVHEYGITISQLTINDIDYEDKVKNQIAQRQEAIQTAVLSQSKAIKAQQDAITAESDGKAEAMKAKWAQEKINAKEIAEAEKNKRVAELEAQAAEQTKRKLILEGEGEATKKRLIMEADGALEKKLEAAVSINKSYADAIARAQPGAWTPAVTLGADGKNSNAAQELVQMLTAKTAKDLGIEMQASGASKTGKK